LQLHALQLTVHSFFPHCYKPQLWCTSSTYSMIYNASEVRSLQQYALLSMQFFCSLISLCMFKPTSMRVRRTKLRTTQFQHHFSFTLFSKKDRSVDPPTTIYNRPNECAHQQDRVGTRHHQKKKKEKKN